MSGTIFTYSFHTKQHYHINLWCTINGMKPWVVLCDKARIPTRMVSALISIKHLGFLQYLVGDAIIYSVWTILGYSGNKVQDGGTM